MPVMARFAGSVRPPRRTHFPWTPTRSSGCLRQPDRQGSDIGMAEPERDLANIMGSLKHGDGAAVPKLMRRHGAISQGLAGLRSSPDMLGEDVFEAGPRHGGFGSIDEDLGRTDIAAYSQPGTELGRGLLPERHAPLPSPFSTNADAWSSLQRYACQRVSMAARIRIYPAEGLWMLCISDNQGE